MWLGTRGYSSGAPACCPLTCGTCRSIAISSNEEQLALSLQGGPAFTLALNNQELMKADDMNFELLGPGVHTAGELQHRVDQDPARAKACSCYPINHGVHPEQLC